MSFIRDFFRRRRVAHHIAQHGWVFQFHGVKVEIPEGSEMAVANALIRRKYEAEEARLIETYMPADRPVLELGGSLGIVSGLIGKILNAGVPHLIVEANPNLIDICTLNARAHRDSASCTVLCKAVAYNGPTAKLAINKNPHSSMLSANSGSGIGPEAQIVEVEATTLAELWRGMGAPPGFTLICDIEGAEIAMVDHDADTLAHAELVVMELHPRLHPEGAAMVARISDTMTRTGFSFVEQASEVYVWRKITDDAK